jgi:hypothetical protein
MTILWTRGESDSKCSKNIVLDDGGTRRAKSTEPLVHGTRHFGVEATLSASRVTKLKVHIRNLLTFVNLCRTPLNYRRSGCNYLIY